MASTLKRFLIGRPLATHEEEHQRIPKTIGLATFSSDAISSTAYATQEILLVLVPVGGMAIAARSDYTFGYLTPIAVLVTVLLALVANSYRQTIHAYPDGGGAYVVSRENLGEIPSLVAGGSLLVDYVLTVSVSVAAGTQAIYSAAPALAPYKIELCLGFVALLTVANLRGVKESGRLFAVPSSSPTPRRSPSWPRTRGRCPSVSGGSRCSCSPGRSARVPWPSRASRPSPTASPPSAGRRRATPPPPWCGWPGSSGSRSSD